MNVFHRRRDHKFNYSTVSRYGSRISYVVPLLKFSLEESDESVE